MVMVMIRRLNDLHWTHTTQKTFSCLCFIGKNYAIHTRNTKT